MLRKRTCGVELLCCAISLGPIPCRVYRKGRAPRRGAHLRLGSGRAARDRSRPRRLLSAPSERCPSPGLLAGPAGFPRGSSIRTSVLPSSRYIAPLGASSASRISPTTTWTWTDSPDSDEADPVMDWSRRIATSYVVSPSRSTGSSAMDCTTPSTTSSVDSRLTSARCPSFRWTTPACPTDASTVTLVGSTRMIAGDLGSTTAPGPARTSAMTPSKGAVKEARSKRSLATPRRTCARSTAASASASCSSMPSVSIRSRDLIAASRVAAAVATLASGKGNVVGVGVAFECSKGLQRLPDACLGQGHTGLGQNHLLRWPRSAYIDQFRFPYRERGLSLRQGPFCL